MGGLPTHSQSIEESPGLVNRKEGKKHQGKGTKNSVFFFYLAFVLVLKSRISSAGILPES